MSNELDKKINQLIAGYKRLVTELLNALADNATPEQRAAARKSAESYLKETPNEGKTDGVQK
jgi:hypothetical protein